MHVLSTMQDTPMLVTDILRHGRDVYGDSLVLTVTDPTGEHVQATFDEVARRAGQLANALAHLGVQADDRVGTFLWNNQRHLEAYLAVPSMGAILHTLNVRLAPDQLAHVVNHAEDRVLIVDAMLVPLLAAIWDRLTTVEHVIVATGSPDGSGAVPGSGTPSAEGSPFGSTLDYEELVTAEGPDHPWPRLDERQAASMCYTSGTTGDPKGVVYSHRSTFLHALAVSSAAALGIGERDRLLAVVPMFHVHAWGTPYTAFLVGADLLMPQQFLQGGPLAALIARCRPTVAAGVPTIWNDLLRFAASNPADLSSLHRVVSGGAAAPRNLFEGFDTLGIELVQGWGMTETSPMGAVALPPRAAAPGHDLEWRMKAGRVMPGVEMRICDDDGTVLPNDGTAIGEFEVRGPWITGSYYREPAPERFHDGWLRTGDVGTLDPLGYMKISDRTKDVIKSGGEWILSVDLENEIMTHPGVHEAAVVAVPDPRWSERPLAVVVRAEGATVGPDELVAYLQDRVPRWWLPERWAFVDELPKTSVGKFDKKALRALQAAGSFDVVEAALPAARAGERLGSAGSGAAGSSGKDGGS